MQALFLRHEGYLGAIGAFLKGAEEEGNRNVCLFVCYVPRAKPLELHSVLETLSSPQCYVP